MNVEVYPTVHGIKNLKNDQNTVPFQADLSLPSEKEGCGSKGNHTSSPSLSHGKASTFRTCIGGPSVPNDREPTVSKSANIIPGDDESAFTKNAS
jgi:hypothetical protein